jgi:replicative DNA helicase
VVVLLWRPVRQIQNKQEDRKKIARMLRLTTTETDLLGKKKIIKLWRNKDEPALTPEQIKERNDQIEHYAELILAKQRNGPVNDVTLRFEAEFTRFQNVTKKSWSNREDERQQHPEDDDEYDE